MKDRERPDRAEESEAAALGGALIERIDINARSVSHLCVFERVMRRAKLSRT